MSRQKREQKRNERREQVRAYLKGRIDTSATIACMLAPRADLAQSRLPDPGADRTCTHGYLHCKLCDADRERLVREIEDRLACEPKIPDTWPRERAKQQPFPFSLPHFPGFRAGKTEVLRRAAFEAEARGEKVQWVGKAVDCACAACSNNDRKLCFYDGFNRGDESTRARREREYERMSGKSNVQPPPSTRESRLQELGTDGRMPPQLFRMVERAVKYRFAGFISYDELAGYDEPALRLAVRVLNTYGYASPHWSRECLRHTIVWLSQHPENAQR